MSNSNAIQPMELGRTPFIKRLTSNRLIFPVVILLIVVIQNILTRPDFFDISMSNGLLSGYIPTILDEASTLVIVTLGMQLVIAASGGPDISVGAIMAIAASFCGLMLNGAEYRTEVFHNPLILAMLVGLLGGALCGAFNGFLVSGLKIQPMIATLVLYTAGRSIAKQITYGQTIYISNPVYKYLGVQIPGVPIRTTILVSIAVVILVVLFMKLTSFSLYVQGVGMNRSSSRLVGLKSGVVIFGAFVLCGVLAGMAGLVESSSLGSVNSADIGPGIEMDAILAVALGGNLIAGGKFSIGGSIIGAYTIQAITTSLYAMNVRADQLYVFKALIIIVIIVVGSDKKNLAALVLGIIGLVSGAFTPLIGALAMYIGGAASIVAIVLGAIAMNKAKKAGTRDGKAMAGMILGIVGAGLIVVMAILTIKGAPSV